MPPEGLELNTTLEPTRAGFGLIVQVPETAPQVLVWVQRPVLTVQPSVVQELLSLQSEATLQPPQIAFDVQAVPFTPPELARQAVAEPPPPPQMFVGTHWPELLQVGVVPEHVPQPFGLPQPSSPQVCPVQSGVQCDTFNHSIAVMGCVPEPPVFLDATSVCWPFDKPAMCVESV